MLSYTTMPRPPTYPYTSSITFLEKPASPDEMTIAALIQKLLVAYKRRDFDTVLGTFAENASIRSWSTNEKIALHDYAKILRQNTARLVIFKLTDIIIRVANSGQAVVSVTVFAQYIDGRQYGPSRRIWDFEKINGQWLITAFGPW